MSKAIRTGVIMNFHNGNQSYFVTLSAARETFAPDHPGDGQQGSISRNPEILRPLTCPRHVCVDASRAQDDNPELGR